MTKMLEHEAVDCAECSSKNVNHDQMSSSRSDRDAILFSRIQTLFVGDETGFFRRRVTDDTKRILENHE
jgi:hypothetical protein